MASTLQQTYYDTLIAHVRADHFPSHQLLDRVEASFWTGDQITEYIEVLLEKIAQDRYPSHQLLDRIERLLQLTATVA